MVPMSADLPIREGVVPFRGQRTWYRVVGDGEAAGKLPLVLINGGPGAPHDYLEPLAEWARAGRRIVFYDQLGSGDSDHPHDPGLWTVELFVAELRAVREALGLAPCHLLGQSWGGLLALEHALAHPQAALTRHEAAGTTGSAEYEEAMMVYYGRHVCRLDPWPECLLRAYARLREDPEVYTTMWGPSEFRVTGTLKKWDVSLRLSGIEAPALVLGGRHDECTPALQEDLHRRLPGSAWTVFEASAHLPHLEEPQRFREVVEGFLERVERVERVERGAA